MHQVSAARTLTEQASLLGSSPGVSAAQVQTTGCDTIPQTDEPLKDPDLGLCHSLQSLSLAGEGIAATGVVEERAPTLQELVAGSVVRRTSASLVFPISVASALEVSAPPVLRDVRIMCQFMPPFPCLEGLQLHPATARCLPVLGQPLPSLDRLPLGTVVHLYTDGSRGARGSGLAVVILVAVPGERWHFQGILAAPTSASLFLERSHGSDEAESAALSGALSWCLSLPAHLAAIVHVDCDAARHFATGFWGLPEGPEDQLSPAAVSRSLFILLKALSRAPCIQAVRGHSQHPWNELADVAAKAASDSSGPACDFCWPVWTACSQSFAALGLVAPCQCLALVSSYGFPACFGSTWSLLAFFYLCQ